MNLDDILNSDMDLTGLSVEESAELMGLLERLPAPKKALAMKKIVSKPPLVLESNSRAELQKRVGLLPANIRKELMEKRLQFSDARYYVVKDIAGKSSIKMFQNQDTKAPGTGNVNGQQLEKDYYFLLSGLILLSGVDPVKEQVSFDIIPDIIRNGEFEFKAAKKTIIPNTSCEIFDTSGRDDLEKGLFKLDNPKLIEPQTDIELNVEFAAQAPASTWMKAILVGTVVAPY